MSWADDYTRLQNEPPAAGRILETLEGKPVKINIELVQGKPPFMYAVCYIPMLVGAPVNWFARSIDDNATHGWKCILMPRARDMVIKARGISQLSCGVQALKVIRKSESGKAFLVEIERL